MPDDEFLSFFSLSDDGGVSEEAWLAAATQFATGASRHQTLAVPGRVEPGTEEIYLV